MNCPNFYILAMGRSGTTLLQNLLDSHPNIVVPPESFFVLHLYTKYKYTTNWCDKTIALFIKDVYTDRPFRLFWRIPRQNLESAFHTSSRPTSFKEACNIVRSSYKMSFLEKSICLIGDKNPLYSIFTNRILSVSPNAKIIHVVRDPRGTINSQIYTFKRKDVLALGYIWSSYNKKIQKLKHRYPNQYLLIKYEDLIINTEKKAQEICSFLEIPYDIKMLSYREDLVERFQQYSMSLKGKHTSLMKPIDKTIIEKWKKSLTKPQLKYIHYSTAKMANKLGYELAFEKDTIPLKVLAFTSKLKVWVGFLSVFIFFNLPFFIRKKILQLRSKLSDHKYWPEQNQSGINNNKKKIF
jgi:hypothetical protein